MLITAVDLNYNIMEVITAEINSKSELFNIKFYKRIYFNNINISKEYINSLKAYSGDILIIGLNSIKMKTIMLSISKKNKKVSKYIFFFSKTIFSKRKCLFKYYVKHKHNFFLRIYNKYSLNRNIKIQYFMHVIFKRDIKFYFKFFHILKYKKKYIISKEKSIHYIFRIINTNSNLYLLTNRKILNTINITKYEINISITKYGKIINNYSLYYKYSLNYTEIIQKIHQSSFNDASSTILIIGEKIYFLIIKKYLKFLSYKNVHYVRKMDFLYKNKHLKFYMPFLYVFSFLDRKHNKNYMQLKKRIKYLYNFKNRKYINIVKNIYFLIPLCFILFIMTIKNTHYSNIINIINDMCFVEVLKLIKKL